jgi:hypothetical protein
MEARLVRAELQKCYRGEGVNHLQNCKELAELYAGMIRANKVGRCTGMGWIRGVGPISRRMREIVADRSRMRGLGNLQKDC